MIDSLGNTLRRVRARMLWQAHLENGAAMLAVACATGLLWLVAVRLFPVLGSPLPVVGGLAFSALAVACGAAWLRRPSLDRAAMLADERLALRERLTSAWQLRDAEGPMLDALRRDALARTASVDPARVRPFAVPRRAPQMVAAVLALGLAFFILPEFDVLGHRAGQAAAAAEEQARRESAERLRATAEALAPERPETDETPGERFAGEIQRVAEQIESGEITEKQALARLENLAEKMAAEREQLGLNKQTARNLNDLPAAVESEAGKEAAAAMQQGDFQKASDALQKMAGELDEAAKQAAAGDPEAAQRARQIAEDMRKMSEALGGRNSELGRRLAEAAAQAGNLANMTPEQARQALEQMNLSAQEAASAMRQLAQIQQGLQGMANWEKIAARQGQDGQQGQGDGQPLTAQQLDDIFQQGGAGQGRIGQIAGLGQGQGAAARGWAPGNSDGRSGAGMGGAGQGAGGAAGETPDLQGGFNPTLLSGERTKGKALATIMQKTAPPDEANEPTVEFVEETFADVRQREESALEKQEIPPGSKEFVRQYFGSIEPDARREIGQ